MYKILIPILSFVTIAFALERPKIHFIPMKYNSDEGFFTIPLSFGSNNEIFEVQIDTTSTKTWIPSSKFPYNVKKYDISKSSTGKITRKSLDLEDIDGTVTGKVCYDSIKIGYFKLYIGFGLIDTVDYKFNDYRKGKLGLGLDQENEDDFNLIKVLKNNGKIDKEVFTIEKMFNNIIIGETGKIFTNFSSSECPIVKTKHLANKFRNSWACQLSSFSFGIRIEYQIEQQYTIKDIIYENLVNVNNIVVFDSSYKYINFPESYLDIFVKSFIKNFEDICVKFNDLNSVYFVCYDESVISNCNLDFIINGFTYILFFENLFKKINEGEYELLVRFYKDADNVFIFGNPFMYNFTTSYDYEEKKLSFYFGNSYSRNDIEKLFYKHKEKEAEESWQKIKKILIGIAIFISLLIVVDNCKKKEYKRNRYIN